MKQRSPEAKRVYFEGYLAALKTMIKITEESSISIATRDRLLGVIKYHTEMAEVSLRSLGQE